MYHIWLIVMLVSMCTLTHRPHTCTDTHNIYTHTNNMNRQTYIRTCTYMHTKIHTLYRSTDMHKLYTSKTNTCINYTHQKQIHQLLWLVMPWAGVYHILRGVFTSRHCCWWLWLFTVEPFIWLLQDIIKDT